MVTWAGFLAEMTLTLDGLVYVRRWADIANRVQAIYSRLGDNMLTNGSVETGNWTAETRRPRSRRIYPGSRMARSQSTLLARPIRAPPFKPAWSSSPAKPTTRSSRPRLFRAPGDWRLIGLILAPGLPRPTKLLRVKKSCAPASPTRTPTLAPWGSASMRPWAAKPTRTAPVFGKVLSRPELHGLPTQIQALSTARSKRRSSWQA